MGFIDWQLGLINWQVSYPILMLLYFGTFGSVGAILFTLVVWHWMKVYALAKGSLRSMAIWNMIGYMFLFIAAYSACGIGGPPGNLLHPDSTTHNLSVANFAAGLSIFFSVPGWLCVLIGQLKMRRDIQ